jgi:hypothetical protein
MVETWRILGDIRRIHSNIARLTNRRSAAVPSFAHTPDLDRILCEAQVIIDATRVLSALIRRVQTNAKPPSTRLSQERLF